MMFIRPWWFVMPSFWVTEHLSQVDLFSLTGWFWVLCIQAKALSGVECYQVNLLQVISLSFCFLSHCLLFLSPKHAPWPSPESTQKRPLHTSFDKLGTRLLLTLCELHVGFWLCDKCPRGTVLTRERVSFDSQFQRAQPMVSWIHCFWLEERQTFVVASAMYGKAAYLMVARKEKGREKQGESKRRGKENEEKKEEVLGKGLSLSGTLPMTPFFPVGDTSPCHPLVHQHIHHLSTPH